MNAGGVQDRGVAATPSPSADRDDEMVVDVRQVSKKFCRSLKRSLWYGANDIFSELLLGTRKSDRLRPQEFWALQEVSLQIRQGEAVALVGRNGAGKTTLLRMIAGLIRPDQGEIRTRGRVAPLLALGAGFNPILTGRENIFVNMAILGLSTSQIKSRLDAVVDFAEIESAIDAPVRTYSSGMLTRLGFACAIHTEPDVLLIDEVLAVGDVAFRGKCYRRLAELRKRKTAFVLVSHSPHSLLSICDSGLYLDEGREMGRDAIRTIMTQYEAGLVRRAETGANGSVEPTRGDSPQASATGLRIESIFFRNEQGAVIPRPETGRPVYLCVQCHAEREFTQANLAAIVRESLNFGETALGLSAGHDEQWLTIPAGRPELRLYLPTVCLKPGFYAAQISVSQSPMYRLDTVEAFRFEVHSGRPLGNSTFFQPREWRVVA